MTHETEVDGVRTLLAPTTGPLHAGLAFRVGIGDEELPRRGITHLVEHLALYPVGVADYHYNGATAVRYTYFHMEGSQAEVVQFLNGVCTSLRSLPTARLAAEKEVLRTEAQGRAGSIRASLDMWRYGARGFGTSAYPELGVAALTEEDLHGWVQHYFTAQNAVLWVAADEVPPGLRLELPQGERRPLPPTTSALPTRPAYFVGDEGAVGWDAVVPHSLAAGVFSGVLERCLRRALRHDAGLSYQVSTDREALGDGTDVVTAYADALPEKQGAVLGGMVDTLAALRVGRVEQADVAAVVESTVDSWEQSERVASHLPGQAIGLLLGRPVQRVADLGAELRAVTTRDVADVALAAWQDGLAMIPPGPGAEWAGFVRAPVASTSVVEGGGEHPQLEDPSVRLLVSNAGVSLVRGSSPPGTVLFDECVAVLAWPDGARRLIGPDGITVPVEPTLYAPVDGLVAFIDERTPPGVRIDRPSRDPAEVPAPPVPEVSATTSVPARRSTTRGVIALVALLPVLLAGVVIAGFGVIDFFVDPDRVVLLDILLLVVGLFLLVAAGWFCRRVILNLTR